MKKYLHIYFLVFKGLSSEDVRVARGNHGRDLVSKPAIALKEIWGGYCRRAHLYDLYDMCYLHDL